MQVSYGYIYIYIYISHNQATDKLINSIIASLVMHYCHLTQSKNLTAQCH